MISGYLVGHAAVTNKGMGNQMFAMAAVCATAWDNGDTPAFAYTGSQSLYKDNIFKNAPFDLEGMPSTWTGGHYKEKHFHYTPIAYKPGMYLYGYFQSPKYFEKQKEKINKLFYPSTFDQARLTADLDVFIKHKGRLGAIHVRRTDYVGNEAHTSLTMKYYKEAMNYFVTWVDHWIVCSDDIAWCKEKFKDIPNITFSTNVGDGPDDMWLMSLCDHHIIANSTYSWWSAWLCKNPNKRVVYPTNWFGSSLRDTHTIKDLIPDEWIGVREI